MKKELLKILDSLIELKEISTNYNSFITKFVTKSKQKNGKGQHYLHGSLKLCTTISGRPTGGGTINMLALPSTGSVLAKPVKSCFRVHHDRLLIGADYSSQEGVCAGLVTKDPAMLDSMIDGIDQHSMRVVAYTPEVVPKHVKLLKQAETASKFYIDTSKSGVDKFKCK